MTEDDELKAKIEQLSSRFLKSVRHLEQTIMPHFQVKSSVARQTKQWVIKQSLLTNLATTNMEV